MLGLLDYDWAIHLIYKYEEEHDLIVESSEIDSVLRKIMYEKDLECDKETYEYIVYKLINNK